MREDITFLYCSAQKGILGLGPDGYPHTERCCPCKRRCCAIQAHVRDIIWVTSLIRGLRIGHLSKTGGSQLRLPKSMAFCIKNAASKERLFGYFEGTLRFMILMLPISLDFFWQSLSMVQSTTKSFTKASRKLHEWMLPAHSPWWRTLWEWISNGCLWISMDFLCISIDFLWMSIDFLHFASENIVI